MQLLEDYFLTNNNNIILLKYLCTNYFLIIFKLTKI